MQLNPALAPFKVALCRNGTRYQEINEFTTYIAGNLRKGGHQIVDTHDTQNTLESQLNRYQLIMMYSTVWDYCNSSCEFTSIAVLDSAKRVLSRGQCGSAMMGLYSIGPSCSCIIGMLKVLKRVSIFSKENRGFCPPVSILQDTDKIVHLCTAFHNWKWHIYLESCTSTMSKTDLNSVQISVCDLIRRLAGFSRVKNISYLVFLELSYLLSSAV